MPGPEAAIHRAASELGECHSERYPQFGRGSVRQRAFERVAMGERVMPVGRTILVLGNSKDGVLPGRC
jgi:hypothetical protein